MRVEVSNPCASVQSPPASLNIHCPADLTAAAIVGAAGYGVPDRRVNNDDFFYHLSRFAAGSVNDCDMTTTGSTMPGVGSYRIPDGVLDRDDFLVYLMLLGEGC